MTYEEYPLMMSFGPTVSMFSNLDHPRMCALTCRQDVLGASSCLLLGDEAT